MMKQLIVDTQGARLHKQGERLTIELEGKTVDSVPMGSLQQVVLMGRGVSASTALLYDLVRRGVDVVYQSQRGRFGFRLVGPASKHSALRVRQVEVAADSDAALALARAAVLGKMHNQATALRRYAGVPGHSAQDQRAKHAMQTIAEQMPRARQAATLDSLRGYEGTAAAAYFSGWASLFDARRWGFGGRAYHPPPDPVNAMLSLGYTLLLHDIVGAAQRIGLDPAIGFFHVVDYGRPSLALDLEEEFRPVIVDTLVLGILRQGLLEPVDFGRDSKDETGVWMSDDARRFFLARYEERMGVKVRHPSWEQRLTYRQCVDRQVEHMARCILGRDEAYRPLLVG
jgi:CRISPR-associated protein Cas1